MINKQNNQNNWKILIRTHKHLITIMMITKQMYKMMIKIKKMLNPKKRKKDKKNPKKEKTLLKMKKIRYKVSSKMMK